MTQYITLYPSVWPYCMPPTEYMAPELVRDPNAKFLQYSGGSSSSSSRQGYDAKKVDAWAIGVLFYVLIAATYPFSVS